MYSLRLLTTLFTLLLLCGTGSAETPSIAVGDRLSEALKTFATQDLNIIFSSRVVHARLAVLQLPNPQRSKLEQIQFLLKPHGLELVMTSTIAGYIRKIGTPASLHEEQTEKSPPQIPSAIQTSRSMEEIIVSAPYRVEGRRFQSNSLAKEELVTLPSLGGDTLRSLNQLPGSAPSGVSARQRFRGGDNNEVLYRLDGITLAEPFHLKSAQSLFSAFNPNIIDSANVYLSGFPVSFGTRMSGVVDLNLVEPQEALTGNLDINTITGAINAAGVRNTTHWLISARQSLVDQVLRAVTSDYGTPEFDDQLFRIGWLGNNSNLTLGGLRSTESIDLKDIKAGEQGKATNRNETLWLNWRIMHTQGLESQWRLVWNKTRTNRSGELDQAALSTGELTDKRFYRAYGLANDWRWLRSKEQEITAGWSVEQQSGRFQSNIKATYNSLATPIQGVLSLNQQTRVISAGETSSAYLSVLQSLTDQLSITAGVRYDGQHLDSVNVTEFSARTRFNYQISPQLHSFLDVGRYTQQQQLLEIQTDDGKAELDAPQHSDQIIVGMLWDLTSEFTLRIEAYYRKINNPWSRYDNLYNRWVLLPELQGDRYLLAASEARARGVEAGIRGNWGNQFDWYLNYAFSDAEDRVNRGWVKRPWHQRHSAKGGVRWVTQDWQLGLSLVYRSGWPTTDFVTNANQLPSRINRSELPDHFSLDLHLGRVFRSAAGELELYLDISNATNRRNVGGFRYATDGTATKERLLPIVPAIGLSWHW